MGNLARLPTCNNRPGHEIPDTPYHSWERGTNENTNGLLRQYFPKGISLDDVTDETLQTIVNRINKRPRRVLGYSTPEEIFVRAKNYQERKSRSHNLNPV